MLPLSELNQLRIYKYYPFADDSKSLFLALICIFNCTTPPDVANAQCLLSPSPSVSQSVAPMSTQCPSCKLRHLEPHLPKASHSIQLDCTFQLHFLSTWTNAKSLIETSLSIWQQPRPSQAISSHSSQWNCSPSSALPSGVTSLHSLKHRWLQLPKTIYDQHSIAFKALQHLVPA